MKALICDKCKQVIADKADTKNVVRLDMCSDFSGKYDEKHLCDTCKKKFCEWLNESNVVIKKDVQLCNKQMKVGEKAKFTPHVTGESYEVEVLAVIQIVDAKVEEHIGDFDYVIAKLGVGPTELASSGSIEKI